jgi:transcriptional regulator
MYIPPAFNEERLDVQHALIRAHPLGLLISAGDEELLASPLPFHLVTDVSPFGTLQGHLARGNPHWKSLDGRDALVVFQGVESYISPSWYESKREHGKVVPTWNYAMVQARGRVRVIDDAEWLRVQIGRLTNDHEGERAHPWHVTDAPDAFIDAQVKGIVGLEIVIRHIEGKWKVSQNRPPADRATVATRLEVEGKPDMSALVKRYGAID